jgi:outer membrane immunogenic protein
MRKLFSLGISAFATVMLGGAAQAADMPLKAPPPPPAPVYSWTGCYIGAGGGYGMWNQDVVGLDTIAGPFTATQTGGGRGWFGTAQVGCDYQLSSNWVIGAFGDWDFMNIKGNPHFTVDGVGNEKEKWAWSVGGRIGYLIAPQVLTYFSGGFREAHFNQVDLFDEFLPSTRLNLFVPAHTYTGWFLGGGYEYGLSWFPGLFWKTEYRYAQFNSNRLIEHVGTTGLATTTAFDSKKFEQTIRTELVWRFNWGGPLRAAY